MSRSPDMVIAGPADMEHVADAVAEAIRFFRGRSRPAPGKGSIYALRLLISELCSNVARHAYPSEKPGSFRLEIWLEPGGAVVQVTDHGRGFRWGEESEGSNVFREGGFGLQLVLSYSDRVEWRSSSDGTVVRCWISWRDDATT